MTFSCASYYKNEQKNKRYSYREKPYNTLSVSLELIVIQELES